MLLVQNLEINGSHSTELHFVVRSRINWLKTAGNSFESSLRIRIQDTPSKRKSSNMTPTFALNLIYLILPIGLVHRSEGITCYSCMYTTRLNVSFVSEYSCLNELENVTLKDCNKYYPPRRYCLKAYEDGALNGQSYKTIVRTCVGELFPTPCVTGTKSSQNPIYKRALDSIDTDSQIFQGGAYGSITMCLCGSDKCNDELGFNTTKGNLTDAHYDSPGSNHSLASWVLLALQACWLARGCLHTNHS